MKKTNKIQYVPKLVRKYKEQATLASKYEQQTNKTRRMRSSTNTIKLQHNIIYDKYMSLVCKKNSMV